MEKMENAEEVRNTNLYHSSFVIIIMSITIPWFGGSLAFFQLKLTSHRQYSPIYMKLKLYKIYKKKWEKC